MSACTALFPQTFHRSIKLLDHICPYETHNIGLIYVGPGQVGFAFLSSGIIWRGGEVCCLLVGGTLMKNVSVGIIYFLQGACAFNIK